MRTTAYGWFSAIGLQTARFRNDSVAFAYHPSNSGPRDLDFLSAGQPVDGPGRSAFTNVFERVVIKPPQEISLRCPHAKSLVEGQDWCVPTCVPKEGGPFFRKCESNAEHDTLPCQSDEQ